MLRMPAGWVYFIGLSPLTAAGDLGNRIEGLRARSFGIDFVIADVLSITIVICLPLHYRNVTAHLRQVYDFPDCQAYSPCLMKGVFQL